MLNLNEKSFASQNNHSPNIFSFIKTTTFPTSINYRKI